MLRPARRGRQFGFTPPAVRFFDAGRTGTLRLLLPGFTSDGAPTLIDAGVTYGTAGGSAHAGANDRGNGGMIPVPRGTEPISVPDRRVADRRRNAARTE